MQINPQNVATINDVPFYKVPVGFPKSRGISSQSINHWIKEANPDFTKKITPLSIAGMFSSVLGVGVAFFSKAEFRIVSVLASIGLLVTGIFTMIAGLFDVQDVDVSKQAESFKPEQVSSVSPSQEMPTSKASPTMPPADTGLINDVSKPVQEKDQEINALIEMFNNRGNEVELRKRVAILLGKNQHRKAQKPLTDCIKRKTDDPEVRSMAAYSLGLRTKAHEIKRAFSAMLPRLIDENENLMVRQHIAIALGEIGDYDMLPKIKALRDSDNEMFETLSYVIERLEARLS